MKLFNFSSAFLSPACFSSSASASSRAAFGQLTPSKLASVEYWFGCFKEKASGKRGAETRRQMGKKATRKIDSRRKRRKFKWIRKSWRIRRWSRIWMCSSYSRYRK